MKHISERGAKWILILLFLTVFFLSQWFQPGFPSDPGDKSPGTIAGLQDLNGKTFATVTGSVSSTTIAERYPDSDMLYVSDWADQALLVSQGKADAFIAEVSSVPYYLENYPELLSLPEPVSSLDSCWVAAKTPKGQEVIGLLDSFVEGLEEDGTLQEIYDRWEDRESAPDHVEAFEKTGPDRGELRVVSSLDWSPYLYVNGSEPCGSWMELMERFCAFAGYTPVYEFVDIQSALAGFSAGKYDFFCYGFDITEERTEVGLFSRILCREPMYVLINRADYALLEENTEEGPEKAPGMLSSFYASFEKTFLRENRWRMILGGLWVTAKLSLFSCLFGTGLGALVCSFRRSRNPFALAFSKIYIRFFQGIPIVLLLLILYYVVLGKLTIPPFWVCVLGFSLEFSAYTAEIFRSGLEAVPAGQDMAARALGFSAGKTFGTVIVPQALATILPVYRGELVSLVKLTSVAGYISLQDLTKVSDLIRSRTYEAFLPLIATAVLYFFLASVLSRVLILIERRVNPSLRPRRIKGVNMRAS